MQVAIDYSRRGQPVRRVVEGELTVTTLDIDKLYMLLRERHTTLLMLSRTTGVSFSGMVVTSKLNEKPFTINLRDAVALANFFTLTKTEFCERVDLKVWKLQDGEMKRYI